MLLLLTLGIVYWNCISSSWESSPITCSDCSTILRTNVILGHISPPLSNIGRPGKFTSGRIADDDHVVVNAIHTGFLVLRPGGLDDLKHRGEEGETTEPPHEAFGGIDVLTIEIEAHFGGDAVVPHGVDVLDELLGRGCMCMYVRFEVSVEEKEWGDSGWRNNNIFMGERNDE